MPALHARTGGRGLSSRYRAARRSGGSAPALVLRTPCCVRGAQNDDLRGFRGHGGDPDVSWQAMLERCRDDRPKSARSSQVAYAMKWEVRAAELYPAGRDPLAGATSNQSRREPAPDTHGQASASPDPQFVRLRQVPPYFSTAHAQHAPLLP